MRLWNYIKSIIKTSHIYPIILVSIFFVVFIFIKTKAEVVPITRTTNTLSNIKESATRNNEIKIIDTSKYNSIFPIQIGTKWIYEGKRIFYDQEQQKIQETISQKTVEITSVKREGDNLRINTQVSYKNEPELLGGDDSFLINLVPDSDIGLIFGYAFYKDNITYFPLVRGQRLTPSDLERTDNLYVDYVSSVSIKTVLGKQHKCYDISYFGLPDESLEVFCENIGYIEDSYKHHGTPNEWNYKLISLDQPIIKDI